MEEKCNSSYLSVRATGPNRDCAEMAPQILDAEDGVDQSNEPD